MSINSTRVTNLTLMNFFCSRKFWTLSYNSIHLIRTYFKFQQKIAKTSYRASSHLKNKKKLRIRKYGYVPFVSGSPSLHQKTMDLISEENLHLSVLSANLAGSLPYVVKPPSVTIEGTSSPSPPAPPPLDCFFGGMVIVYFSLILIKIGNFFSSSEKRTILSEKSQISESFKQKVTHALDFFTPGQAQVIAPLSVNIAVSIKTVLA